MQPEYGYLLKPGTKVVIKNDFYKYPIDSLRKHLGTEMTIGQIYNNGECMMYRMEESRHALFYIQEIDHIISDIDCGDCEYQIDDITELFM